jgi:predicted aspartyl protease
MKFSPERLSILKFLPSLGLATSIWAVFAVAAVAAPPEYRDWTIGGEGSLRAKFVPSTGLGDSITLEEANGKTKIVAFPKISPPDQEYVDLWYLTDSVEKNANEFLVTADISSFLRARDFAVLDYKVSDRAAFFPGKINDKEFKFFIDTGAFASFLNEESARKLGLDLQVLSEDQWGSGIDGIPLKTYACKVDSIDLGEIRVNNHLIRAVDIAQSQYSAHASGRVLLDAVLGYDLLDELDAVITYKGKRIYIPRNQIKKSVDMPDSVRDTLPILNVKANDTRGLNDSVGTPVNVTGMIRAVEEVEGGALELQFFGRRVVASVPKEVADKLPAGSAKRFANQDARVSGILKEVEIERAGRKSKAYRIDVEDTQFIEVSEVWKPSIAARPAADLADPSVPSPAAPVDLSKFTLGDVVGYRTWLDRFGKKLRARPISIEDNTHVKLRVSSNQNYSLPISDLSEEDQAFLKTWPNPSDGNLVGTFLQTISLPEFTSKRGYDSVDFKANDNKIWVKCEVEGEMFDFFIDTGAQSTGMSYAAGEKLGFDMKPNGSAMGWGGKPVPIFKATATDFKIGSAEFKNLELSIIPADWDGIFGWDLLEKLDAAIDYKNKVMYFKK